MKSSELKGKKIAIGQATYTSIQAYHMLKHDGIQVQMFFDRDFRLQHKKYQGTPIFPWANFSDTYILLTIPARYDELKKFLIENCGYTEDKILLLDNITFECTEFDVESELDWRWIAENTNNAAENFISQRVRKLHYKHSKDDGLVAPFLAVDVNNRCTLNCRYCYAQTPYYRIEERRDYTIETVICHLDKLLDAIDYIPYLWILGGEPLLHPQLHALVSYLNEEKAQRKIAFADILTNGTLLLSHETINAIKKNPFFWRISVSPYGKHSKKQFDLFSQLNETGIPYYSRYMTYWQKFGIAVDLSEKGMTEERIRRKCQNCICRNLHLAVGKLYRCPVMLHFEAQNRIPYDERNSFDLGKSYTKDELRRFIDSYSPGMAYCNANHQTRIKREEEMDAAGGKRIIVAEQAEGVLPCKRYNQKQ